MYDITVQMIGFIGMALCVGCFQCKKSSSLLLWQAVGNGVYILHYMMLGAYSGCFSLVILSASNVIQMLRIRGHKWAQWSGCKWIATALLAVFCVIMWRNVFSLLPAAATIALIWTNGTGDGRIMRMGKVCLVGPGWLAYNIYARSYSGMLSESFGIVSALIAICRYHRKKTEGKKQIAENYVVEAERGEA